MRREKWGLNKSQRIKIKLFACLMGLLLIAILLIAKLIMLLIHKEEQEPEPKQPIPVIETMTNVWIMEESPTGILVFRDGEKENYSFGAIAVTPEGVEIIYQPMLEVRENVADVVLTDGKVTDITLKKNKISGKILSADASGVELEGYGKLPLAVDYRGYRLFDSLKMCSIGDLFFGYSYADFCMDNGEICGILMVKDEAMEHIRVLVKASEYSELLHEAPAVTCNVDYTVVYGGYENLKQEGHLAGEVVAFDSKSDYFQAERVIIIPSVLTGKVILRNCKRSQGVPAYRGQIELLKTDDGIAVINEVLLEEYLYSVVPSEMPSSYPVEALKAQAICARTYAYGHMKRAGYPQYGAHVDDSTSYQVYNNIREQESTTTAVKETHGQLLMTGTGELAGTYYYSTSCGVGSDSNVWKTVAAPTLTYLQSKALNKDAMVAQMASRNDMTASKSQQENGDESSDGDDLGIVLQREEDFKEFITSVNPTDFESDIGWYRWTYQVEEVDEKCLLERLQKRYKANEKLVLTWDVKTESYISKEIKKLNDITDIRIEKRGSGGYADELIIETKHQKIKVISEYNIRCVLNDGETKVVLQNHEKVAMSSLLPSGFFVIETNENKGYVTGYKIIGGGYGHGVGLSQNCAGEMAKSGYDASEILLYFYDNCEIKKAYEMVLE